jgi:peptide/nickel transport system permease protein
MKRTGAWALAAMAALTAWAMLMPLAGWDGRTQSLTQSLAPPSWDSMRWWLGRDVYGRSVLVRLADATRHSLALASLSVALAALVGATMAAVAALAARSRWRVLDAWAVAVADAACAIPGLLWVLLGSFALGGSDVALYAGLALAMWAEFFRVLRGLALEVMRSNAVEAARLLGFGPAHVLRVHLWPACAQPLARLAALNLAQAVLAFAALGFIGVGVKPPRADLGLMMTEHLPQYAEAPWLIAAPVAVLMVFVWTALAVSNPTEQA